MQVTKSILIQRALLGVFWVLGTVGFVCDELVTDVESLRTYVNLGCDAILVLLGLMSLRHRADLLSIGSLLLIAITSSLVFNSLPLMLTINGLRVFIGAMFCYPIFRYFMDEPKRRERFVKAFDKNLEMFLWLQIPCIGYQFVVYGAGDHGGGSLGNWYSGTISMMIYLISFYLIKKRINPKHFMSSILTNYKYVLLLAPTFLNETKISFVLLVLYFILLVPIGKRMFTRALFVVPVMSLLFGVGYMTYKMTYQGEVSNKSSATVSPDDVDIFSEEYLTEYVLSDVENAEEGVEWSIDNNESGLADIGRVTKFLLLPMFEEDNPGHVPLGFGVGHFKGGTKMDHSEFFEQYEWYLMGTIPYLIHIYLQLGIIGVLWFIVFLVSLFHRHPVGCSVRDLNMQVFLAILIVINFFYIENMRDPIFCIVLYGLLAMSWLPDSDSEASTD